MSTLNTPAFSGGGPGTDMLSFELLPANVDLSTINSGSPHTATLPTLPRSFRVEKLFLTPYDFDQSWGTSFDLSFRIHDRNFYDYFNTTASINGGLAEFSVNLTLPGQNMNQSTFYFNENSSVYGEYGYGLILWARGTWVN